MPAQCVPQDESRRLQMLASLDVLDRPDEEIFSEYVRLAAELLDAPTALLSLVDERRQWFAGRHGLDAQDRLTLVPLSIYFKDGRAKIELALARGRRHGDYRAAMAERDAKREAERSLGRQRKGME